MKGFWQGRKVLVTGHTGFKGAWLSFWLTTLGAEVTGYALPAKVPSVFTSARLWDSMRNIPGDVNDASHLEQVVAECKPEVVFHLAAQALVRRSHTEPVETYRTNLMGTVNLLEALRRHHGTKALVNVTTDKCYENRPGHAPFRETDALGGSDPYSSSKACAELATAAYRASFFPPAGHSSHGLAIATARAGNVIGGADWGDDRLVPDFVRAATKGQPLLVRNPKATRPWQYVTQPLHGYLLLGERLHREGQAAAGAWNFGPPHTDVKPVSYVADRLVALWGPPAAWTLDSQATIVEHQTLELDASKAQSALAWSCRVGLDDALRRTIDGYRAATTANGLRGHMLTQTQSAMGGA
ncbi:MAG: CDP-glucose 4,6-dehydratase [Thermoplasmatota archaeon]